MDRALLTALALATSACLDWSSLYCEGDGCEGATFTASTNYGDTQRSNRWSYLSSTDLETFADLEWSETAARWVGCSGQCQLFADGGLPDRVFFAVRRWTAPRKGRISITGTAATLDVMLGDGELVEIRHGSTQLWSQRIAATDSRAYPFDETLDVQAGDVIDFVLGNGGAGDNDGDWTRFDPTVTLAPIE